MENIKEGTFLAISNLHLNEWFLNQIEENELKKYETIYILGNTKEESEIGNKKNNINLLLKIKKLSEKNPEKIIYIPGRYDDFLYQYLEYNDITAREFIETNIGKDEINKINMIKANNSIELKKLSSWLGTLKLQREHYYKGQRFVLAPSLFNEKLFEKYEKFSLEDYKRNGGLRGDYREILWYKKPTDIYSSKMLPRGNTIMVIGNTPLYQNKGEIVYFKNEINQRIITYCVDYGVVINGMYIKNEEYKEKFMKKVRSKENDKKEVSIETKEVFNNLVIDLLKSEKSLDKVVDKIIEITYYDEKNHLLDSQNIVRRNNIEDYLEEIYLSSINHNYKSDISNSDYKKIFKLFFVKIVIDYIIKHEMENNNSIEKVADKIDDLLNRKYECIDNIEKEVIDMLKKVGIYNIDVWINENNYESLKEYIINGYGKIYQKKDQ